MANNRLYIGNIKTKKVGCISKDDGSHTWMPLSDNGRSVMNMVLSTDLIWQEKSDLVLFSESDSDLFSYFFNDENDK